MKISNNVLVILLGVAVITSVLGSWYTLSFLDFISGAATSDTGTTNLTITSTTSCTATDDSIDFGSMVQSAQNTSTITNDFMRLNNDGNVNINVVAYASENLFDSYASPTTYWRAYCHNSTTGTCNSTHLILNATQGTAYTLVSSLQFGGSSDNMTVGVNVTVPGDEAAGVKSGTITFFCSSA